MSRSTLEGTTPPRAHDPDGHAARTVGEVEDTSRGSARVVDEGDAAPTEPPVRPARAPLTGPAFPRRRVGAVAGALLVGVLVLALVVGGGAPSPAPAGLPDAGPVTGWGLPVAELSTRVLAVLTIGQLLFAAVLAPSRGAAPSAGALRALHATTWTAAGWVVAEVVALVLTASTIYGVPVGRLSTQSVLGVLTELPAGRSALWVGLLLVVVTVGSALLTWRPTALRAPAGLLLVAALGAVTIPGVLAGHSAAAGNHVPAVVALSVHVVTASLWVGGLAALLMYGRGRVESVHAVRRFSAVALTCLALLLISGVIAALLVAGVPSWSWLGEGWAQLLAVKTVLLTALGLIGWQHRRATLPALEAGRPWTFVRLGVVEVALMALTITVSVALGASAAPSPQSSGTTTSSVGAAADAGGEQETPEDGPSSAAEGRGGEADEPDAGDEPLVEDMSGHDHGDLSVAILIDDERFHVAATVRPGQVVTVYNSSDDAATITALGADDAAGEARGDADFDVEVPARTFITFSAPEAEGDYAFVSSPDAEPVDGFADTLVVRAP